MKRSVHYAWVILGVSFFGVLASQGVRFSFGAFMESWEEFFLATRGTISAVSFLSFIVFAVAQPLAGKMIDQYGVRIVFVVSTAIVGIGTLLTYFATSIWQLFLLYGVISSAGFGGASGVTATVAVTKWFTAKRGLALGLVEAGFGAGQMVIVTSSIFLIELYGWQSTVIILGLFLLLVVCPILGLLLKSEPGDAGYEPLGGAAPLEEVAEPSSIEGGKSRPGRKFWYLLIPFFVCGVTTTGLMDTHLIPFAQYCGFSPAVTSTAVSLLAGFNILGTLAAGVLADKIDNRKILAFLYFGRALTILFLLVFSSQASLVAIFIENPVLLLAFSVSFGLVDFATVPPTVKLMSEYFKGQSLGLLTGWLFMSHQFGSALGSFIPGLLFDYAGNYSLSFLFAVFLLIGAGVLSALLPKEKAQVSV
ncbi:MFS transporter [Bacillus sp. FJAT-27225]|uniref:MFS transporter n=1 Tax=Bacillus sp. FJAT-27225 TaxID=1743144 RepID=UPI00080C2BB7|nr:MFS transporter [Bacillus sp. FJAT-27225]OCA80983.1 MFS transporter [Bacillus sp. FJAT-27225]